MHLPILQSWNKFRSAVALVTLIYVATQVVVRSDIALPLFAALLILVITVGVVVKRADLLVVAFPFIITQHMFTREFTPSNNWISSEFIIPVSMIQIIMVVLFLYLICNLLFSGSVKMYVGSFLLVILVITGLLMTPMTSISAAKTDLILIGPVLVCLFYVTNVQPRPQLNQLTTLLLTVPIGIALGSAMLFIGDRVLGIWAYDNYMTIQWYVFAVLIGMSFEGALLEKKIRWTYYFATTAYLLIFLLALFDANTGTTKLLVIGMLFAIGMMKYYSDEERLQAPIYLAVAAFLSGLIYTILYYTLGTSLPLQSLARKFYTVFSFDLSKIHHSPAVRIISILNIFSSEVANGPLHLIFGNGIGGYFTDSYYPFSEYVRLTTSDFSEQALETHRFYWAHPISGGYLLLKYGLLGLATMGYLAIQSARSYVNTEGAHSIVPLLVLITIPSFGFGVKNSILLGVTLGIYYSDSNYRIQ